MKSTKIAFIGDRRLYTSLYGKVYKQAARIAEERAGCRIRSYVSDKRHSITPDAKYLQNELAALTFFAPHVVFCDPVILFAYPKLKKPLESQLLAATAGKLERLGQPPEGDITLKNYFQSYCAAHGIPVPRSVELKRLSPQFLRHRELQDLLGIDPSAAIVYKAVQSSGGKAVFSVDNEHQLDDIRRRMNIRDFVAQEMIDVGNIPFSMRVVVFGQRIIGGALAINPHHSFCSNAHQGGIAFDLAVPSEATGRKKVPKHNQIKSSELDRIFQQAGVDPFNRVIPEGLIPDIRKICGFPGACLLKGIDVIFNTTGKPFFLECNMHPGPPSSGMWLSITGQKHHTDDGMTKGHREIPIAAEIIGRTLITFGQDSSFNLPKNSVGG